jgi:hypothetical protein
MIKASKRFIVHNREKKNEACHLETEKVEAALSQHRGRERGGV